MPLFVIAAAVGMVLAPGLAALGYLLAGLSGGAPLPPAHWIRWWGNVSAGVLLVAPALIAAIGELRPLWSAGERASDGCAAR